MSTVAQERPGDASGVESELYELLHSRAYRCLRLQRSDIDPHPNLMVASEELSRWLRDPRRYDPKHQAPDWASMVLDVRAAIATRGPKLRQATPSFKAVDQIIRKSALGGDPSRRGHADQANALAHEELRSTVAAVAAFDDLVDAVTSPQTPWPVLSCLALALDAALLAGDRNLDDHYQQLAGVISDSGWYIPVLEHRLNEAPLPDLNLDNGPQPVGRSWDERMALCRQLLSRPIETGHHVVWFAYTHAHVDWRVNMGPITFFHGPALLARVEQSPQEPLEEGLPAELLDLEENRRRIASDWPDDDHWVAVRVDLEQESYADPIRVAREQVDALVRLAVFYSGETAWQLQSGHYMHFVDGRRVGTGFAGASDQTLDEMTDRTGGQLEDMSTHLAPHLPLQDLHLRELLDAAATLDSSEQRLDANSLLDSVRVVEMIADRCNTGWRKHLTETFAIRWARERIRNDVYVPVFRAMLQPALSGLAGMPTRAQLQTDLTGNTPGWRVNYGVAVQAIQVLGKATPNYEPSRQVRWLSANTQSLASVETWAETLVKEHNRLVDRAARCRNSMAHGGPFHPTTAETVTHFARQQAKQTAGLALWSALRGETVLDAHDRFRRGEQAWLDSIPTAVSVEAVIQPARQPTGDGS